MSSVSTFSKDDKTGCFFVAHKDYQALANKGGSEGLTFF
jgi:hypothetical protein